MQPVSHNPSRLSIVKKIGQDLLEELEYSEAGVTLLLNKHTLVPHSDTFELIETARNLIDSSPKIKTIADVGCGSGVIVIKLGMHFVGHNFLASDICSHAIDLAVRNALSNDVDNVEFFLNRNGVWLSEYTDRNIDFIVANPPFVAEKEYKSEDFLTAYPEVKYEPKTAIIASGDDGLEPYMKIIENSAKNQVKMFLFQCNSLNIDMLRQQIMKTTNYNVEILKNSKGVGRFLLIKDPVFKF